MTDQLDQQIRDALRDVMDTAPPPGDVPAGNTSLEPPGTHDPRRRVLLAVAATTLVGGGIAGLAAVRDRQTNDAAESPATAPQTSLTPAPMPTPGTMADGQPTADEQERLDGLKSAGESLGLKMTRSDVLVRPGGSRMLDGAFTDETGEFYVAFTISEATSPPPAEPGYTRSGAGYQYQVDSFGGSALHFDDVAGEFVSISMGVRGESELRLDEATAIEIIDTLLAAT